MKMIVKPSVVSGSMRVPGSKSHTIRALIFGTLAKGTSVVRGALVSRDTLACVDVCRQFGASIEMTDDDEWRITGINGKPKVPSGILDCQNSGTTLYFTMITAALCTGECVFTGDESLKSRPVSALCDAIKMLGANASCIENEKTPPVKVCGEAFGGDVKVSGTTSQYTSALLIHAPYFKTDTIIRVPNLNEKPYVDITLAWMKKLGVSVDVSEDRETYTVSSGQRYKPFDINLAADFSSATFFACAAAITGGSITMTGLDMTDAQGDKIIFEHLKTMGATIEYSEKGVCVTGGKLTGGVFDLNATPDMLPAIAVCACFAHGKTELVNVAQARVKETDRIACMASELKKLGANITENDDGLTIIGTGELHGASVESFDDHRIVMSLAVAGLRATGETRITKAEAVDVTFPTFATLMQGLNADISVIE